MSEDGSQMTGDSKGHRETQEKQQWQSAVDQSIAELSAMLIRDASIEEISHLVLQRAKDLTGSRFGFGGYIDPRTGYLVRPTLTRDIWDECRIREKSVALKEFKGLRGWVLENHKSLLTNAPAEDPRSCGTPEGHIPIRRLLAAPALAGDVLLGEVAVANAQHDYTSRDLDVVERLASLYALAIQRSRMDEELISLERQRALGEMAQGVSHNLNNILVGVLGHAQLLERRVQDPKILKTVRAILKSANRAKEVVDRLNRAALCVEREKLYLVSVNKGVREMAREMQSLWQGKAEVSPRSTQDPGENARPPLRVLTQLEELPPVRGTRAGLKNILINLMQNAADAMSGEGEITVRTRAVGDWVELMVIDTGVGMDHETCSRVFEPFFTTKVTVGHGLGLSTVYATVKRWGGDISLETEPGEGTTFKVKLPIPKYEPGNR
jgi:signal transduction histidine kinase